MPWECGGAPVGVGGMLFGSVEAGPSPVDLHLHRAAPTKTSPGRTQCAEARVSVTEPQRVCDGSQFTGTCPGEVLVPVSEKRFLQHPPRSTSSGQCGATWAQVAGPLAQTCSAHLQV